MPDTPLPDLTPVVARLSRDLSGDGQDTFDAAHQLIGRAGDLSPAFASGSMHAWINPLLDLRASRPSMWERTWERINEGREAAGLGPLAVPRPWRANQFEKHAEQLAFKEALRPDRDPRYAQFHHLPDGEYEYAIERLNSARTLMRAQRERRKLLLAIRNAERHSADAIELPIGPSAELFSRHEAAWRAERDRRVAELAGLRLDAEAYHAKRSEIIADFWAEVDEALHNQLAAAQAKAKRGKTHKP